MTKKKATAAPKAKRKAAPAVKAGRAQAAATPNPIRDRDATGAPPNAATPSPAPRLPFRRPQSLNFAGVGRNDICPCGSGKRFKNCHGH